MDYFQHAESKFSTKTIIFGHILSKTQTQTQTQTKTKPQTQVIDILPFNTVLNGLQAVLVYLMCINMAHNLLSFLCPKLSNQPV